MPSWYFFIKYLCSGEILRKFLHVLIFILYIEFAAFFIYQSSKNGSDSSSLSLCIANFINKILVSFNINIEIDTLHTIVRKLIGHFGFFVFYSLVSYMFYYMFNKKILYIPHFIVGLVLAITSEFVFEANSAGRSANFTDVFIDYSGFIFGSLIIFIIIFSINKHKKIKIEK